MFHALEKQVQRAFHDHIQARYGIDLAVAVEQPKQSDFGELAVPAAFQLAKLLKQAPRKIAAELASGIGSIPGVSALEVAGSGYINIRFNRAAYGQGLLTPAVAETAAASGKVIVEHTNINPNKAAHIGHLRNATLLRDMPGYFLNRQDDAHAVVAEIGSPSLKVQLDLYHCQI